SRPLEGGEGRRAHVAVGEDDRRAHAALDGDDTAAQARALTGGPRALRRSGRRLVDLHLDAEILAHDILEVPAGGLEHLQPAVLPVANAGEPGRAAPAGPRLRAAPLEMESAVLGEGLPVPDFLDRRVVDVREEFCGAERNVLPAQGDTAKGVDVEPFE